MDLRPRDVILAEQVEAALVRGDLPEAQRLLTEMQTPTASISDARLDSRLFERQRRTAP